jgi:hypothetical protein
MIVHIAADFGFLSHTGGYTSPILTLLILTLLILTLEVG